MGLPEPSVLASVNMRTEVFGNLVHQALEKVKDFSYIMQFSPPPPPSS